MREEHGLRVSVTGFLDLPIVWYSDDGQSSEI
jgi:hypothetical protein